MLTRRIRYFFKESFISIYKNHVMALASIGSIAATLCILGVVLIGIMNIATMMKAIESRVEVTAYIRDDVDSQGQANLEQEIRSWEGVTDVTYVSKEQALENMKEEVGNQEAIFDGYNSENNPLPSSFIIKTGKPEYVKNIVEKLKSNPAVDSVNYSQDVVDTLSKISLTTRTLGTGVTLVLLVVSFIIITNTIRLAVINKRREIHIMKYVGATDWFIRWPFVIEGFVIGMTGAILAAAVVISIYRFVIEKEGIVLELVKPVPVHAVSQPIVLYFFLLGGGVGILSSIFSMRKYLRV